MAQCCQRFFQNPQTRFGLWQQINLFYWHLLLFIVVVHAALAQECSVIYVTPGGASSGTAGTKANPASIQYALTLAGGNPARIYMRTGTYNISAPLQIPSNCRIEGGFDSQWRKTNGSETVIFRDFTNVEPNPNRLVAVMATGSSNFELHDLTIRTAHAVTPSTSTYGLYLNGCSNYQLVRLKVYPGNGSNGLPGQGGTPGMAGAPGLPGQDGDEDGPCCTAGGAPGSGSFPGSNPGGAGGDGGPRGTYQFPAGGSAPPGFPGQNAPGAGGGTGGLGGIGVNDLIVSLTSCPRTPINDGSPGSAGQPGTNGTDGADGVASFAGGWFQPADGQPGTDGTHGFGGGGGGGGGSQGYVVVIPALPPLIPNEINTNGAGAGGGGGGEGGQGGTGGTGGTGGGGSFGIFVWNNGPGGVIRDCFYTSGFAGLGGLGGLGGQGGPGGAGGPGGGMWNCDIGAGGNGGPGGPGGNGGKGGKGSDGVSLPLYQDPAGQPLNILNINNLQQPVVTVQYSGCVNSPVTFSTNQTGTVQWFFGANASPPTAYGQTAVTSYTQTGEKTFTMVWNGIPYTYTEFIEIYNTQPNPPVNIVPSATQFCLGQTGQFTSSATGDNYFWTVTGGSNNINQSFSGANLQTLSFTFNDPGTYTLRLQTLNGCCGYSFTDSLQVEVEAPVYPEISIQSSATFTNNVVCEGSQVIFTAAVNNAGNNPTFQWQLNGINTGSNSPTLVLSNPQTGDWVQCIVISSNGCSAGLTDTSQTISLTVISTPVVTCSADSFYTGSPTFFEASVTAGGQAPFTYVWDFGNNTQGSGQTVATVYTQPGFYNVQVDVTDANGCTGTCNLVVQIFNYIKADFKADKFNGCAPLTVHFTNESVNTLTYLWDFGDGYTSNQVHPTHTYYYPGTYNVTLYAFSAVGNLTQSVPNQITVFPSPTANFLAYPQNVTTGSDTVYFADNSVDAWSWFWDFGDPASGAANYSTLQNPTHYYTSNGTYTVTLIVTNNYGCSDTLTKPAFIVKNVGLTDPSQDVYRLQVYPNPASAILFIDLQGPPEDYILHILDGSGKIVVQDKGRSQSLKKSDLMQLAPGLYTLRIWSSEGRLMFTSKLSVLR